MPDLSKQRQKVSRLNQKRTALLKQVLRPKAMIPGCLYQMARHCGNPQCKCAQGAKHVSWYLSRRLKGKTKLTYIGRIVPVDIAKGVQSYRYHQRLLAQIRKIDQEISQDLNGIRDTRIQNIEELSKGDESVGV